MFTRLVLQFVLHLELCSLLTSTGPKILGILVGMDQKDSFLCAHRRLRLWHVHGWFFWYFSPRAVFPSRPVLRIIAGMHQKVCCETALVADIGHLACLLLVLLGFTPRDWFPSWFAGPDARHRGRYEPEGLFRALIPAVACAELVLLGKNTSRCVPPVVVRPR